MFGISVGNYNDPCGRGNTYVVGFPTCVHDAWGLDIASHGQPEMV